MSQFVFSIFSLPDSKMCMSKDTCNRGKDEWEIPKNVNKSHE